MGPVFPELYKLVSWHRRLAERAGGDDYLVKPFAFSELDRTARGARARVASGTGRDEIAGRRGDFTEF